jgi:hypothetical protein
MEYWEELPSYNNDFLSSVPSVLEREINYRFACVLPCCELVVLSTLLMWAYHLGGR